MNDGVLDTSWKAWHIGPQRSVDYLVSGYWWVMHKISDIEITDACSDTRRAASIATVFEVT